MQSLAKMIHEKSKLEDLLFRLVISNCENHAISPAWWEQISSEHKEQITTKATQTTGVFNAMIPTYLSEGLEGIAEWKFDEVVSKME
jgi:hypothetical protein